MVSCCVLLIMTIVGDGDSRRCAGQLLRALHRPAEMTRRDHVFDGTRLVLLFPVLLALHVLIASAVLDLPLSTGLAFFYGGLVAENAVVSTLMLSFGCMAVISVIWSTLGYSLAFAPGNVWYGGVSLVLLDYTNDGLRGGLTITEFTYSMYQLMFAVITAAIISGAVVQRIKFLPFMAFALGWHLLVYCPLAHWIFYSDGWLFRLGVLDFAGGLVVHTASGVSAFVLAYWLGRTARERMGMAIVSFWILSHARPIHFDQVQLLCFLFVLAPQSCYHEFPHHAAP